jgi:hypothetical protein
MASYLSHDQITEEMLHHHCKSLVSYGEWSDLCRQPLLWLSCADPTLSVFEALSEDPDRETLARLLGAWHASFGKTPTMVREAINSIPQFLEGARFSERRYSH